LVGELKGVEPAVVELEDNHIPASSLPGSPRKYHGPRRQTAHEIILRRKKRTQRYKEQKDVTSPTDAAWAAEEAEKKEKRRLGLERRERCHMCQVAFPQGTMQCAVIEKSVHKWRMKQKAVRSTKKKIREAIKNLGDGGAATVFRFAAKSNAEPTISKKGMSFVDMARKKFLKIGKVEGARGGVGVAAHRPSNKERGGGVKSPLKRRRATASSYSTTRERGDSHSSNDSKSSSDLSASSSFKRAAPGAITYDQFLHAIDVMFGLEVQEDIIREELLGKKF
jgi:hypothetical protein